MQKQILILLFFSLFCRCNVSGQTPFSGVSGLFTGDSRIPDVTVSSPNGGETFNYLDPFTVNWTASDDSFGTTPIDIGISTEAGGAITIVAYALPNTGSAVVTPPGIITDTAKVWVFATDDYGIEGSDESDDYFTFDESFSAVSALFTGDSRAPDVTVSSPNGGETFNYLSPFSVNWTASDDSFGATPIDIGISTEAGGAITIVAYALPNTGSAVVTPPGIVTDTAKVWVFATDDYGIEGSDESDDYFTFDESFSAVSGLFTGDSKPPETIVAIPNGGESYPHVDPMTVSWTANDDSFGQTPISIGLSLDQSGVYSIVASNLPNTGQAVINPPGFVTQYAKAWVIAIDTFGLESEDASDDYFNFTEDFAAVSGLFTGDSKPPTVTVIRPNGGEANYYAEPLLVKWDADDESMGTTPITVAVSTDGGTTFTTIASGLPDSDSAFVSAPEVITDSAIVKVYVQDEYGLVSYDESDGMFSLQGIYVDLKAFLEGPFAGSGMLSYLNFFSYIPNAQPYSNPPWNYAGTETVAAMPNDDVADWVLIEIRDAVDAASAGSAAIVAQQAGFILEDGTITTVDGSNPLPFGNEVNQNLFAVVRHRNHLDVMSAYPLNQAGDNFSYDFTDAADKVYGGVLGHKELVPGIWGMVAGDGDASSQINNLDKLDVWAQQAGNAGYMEGDFDMNGNVENPDKLDVWAPNSGTGGQVPDLNWRSQVPE